jgi:hypothetical protein
MGLWQAVLVFLLSAAVLVRAGASLAGYADQIAERMRMSREPSKNKRPLRATLHAT